MVVQTHLPLRLFSTIQFLDLQYPIRLANLWGKRTLNPTLDTVYSQLHAMATPWDDNDGVLTDSDNESSAFEDFDTMIRQHTADIIGGNAIPPSNQMSTSIESQNPHSIKKKDNF